MTLLIGAIAMVLNVIILFFIVRKATRANDQIEILGQLLAELKRPEGETAIQKLIQERKIKGA